MTIDSVSVTPGSGKDIATDTIAGKEFQIIKIALGAEDAVDTVVDSGQQTMANSFPVVIASNQAPVPITSKDNVLELTLSVDTAIYATGDVLADTQELTNFFPVAGQAASINSVAVLDEDHQGGAFDLVFLKSNVSLGTENLAVSISDANAREILGIVSVVAGDYVDLVGSYLATICPVGLVVKTATASVWIAAISRDAKTYTASGLKLKIGIL